VITLLAPDGYNCGSMTHAVPSDPAPPPTAPARAFNDQLSHFAGDIKISHSIFALPWAILATVMAWDVYGQGTIAGKLLLIVVCMVAARTVAMAANRLLDARLDALNPRTARRAIPSGALSKGFYIFAALVCVAIFIAACGGFWLWYRNPWPILLSVPVLLLLSSYPLLKRFTRLCHYYLGAALALAPVCAWIAISGTLNWPPIVMAVAVTTWTAGFDIIYACQDYASDVATGVHSVPAKFGVARALWIARLTHFVCIAALIALGWFSPQLNALYFLGVVVASALLVIEHGIVRADDLSKVGLAFFTINGVISVIVGIVGIIDVLI
jgi:4-hydroxybenzoate polyprenyltransferase